MSTPAIVLRVVSLLAFAAMLLAVTRRRRRTQARARQGGGDRAPLVANLAAFGLHFPSLLVLSGGPAGPTALLPVSSGSLLTVAGVALLRSRADRFMLPS